jgi:hypothetical protein
MEDEQQQACRSKRTDVSFSQSSTVVVLPTDSVDENPQLRSGSKWCQHDLKPLKVKFDPDEDSELSILNVEYEWNEVQRQSIVPDTFL